MFKKIEKELKTKEIILSNIETNQEQQTILQIKRRKDEKKKEKNQVFQLNNNETNKKQDSNSNSNSESEEEDETEKVKKEIKKERKEEGNKEYKGRNNYKKHINKSEIDINNHKYLGNLGPMKANTTIKASSQIDYSRGICKDYKVSGVCGYGDGCIFLHDRTEYKSSYEIDLELKKKEILKKKREIEGLGFGLSNGNKDSKESINSIEDNQNRKEVCKICSKKYVEPVETICRHVFCEGCALRNYSKSKKCFVCNKDVNGIFNSINDINKRKYIV